MKEITSYVKHTEELFELYEALQLKSIDDYFNEDHPKYPNQPLLSFFTDVTRSRPTLKKFDQSDFKMFDDFVILSGDVKFCAGMLHYLLPHISADPNGFSSTLIDRRYLMHVSFGYQSIYHFWDRIGDLLWLYFPTGIDEKKVYTGFVLDRIPDIYKQSTSFNDLKKSYHTFNDMFAMRHDIVHKCSIGTEITWMRTTNYGNEKKLRKLLLKIHSYRDKITKSLPLCIEALYLALNLIKELPEPDNTVEV